MKIFLSIIFLLIIILFPISFLYLDKIGLICSQTSATLINYFGAVFGGFLTLLGVWWTIKDSNNTRKKDLELQYAPVLYASVTEKSPYIYSLLSELNFIYNEIFFDDCELEYINKLISLTNVGRGKISKMNMTLNQCKCIS